MKLFDWEFLGRRGEMLGRALVASAAGLWGPLWLVLAPLTLDRLIYAKQGYDALGSGVGDSWRGCWTDKRSPTTNIGLDFYLQVFIFIFQLCMEEEGYFVYYSGYYCRCCKRRWVGIGVIGYIWGCAVPCSRVVE